MNDELGLELRDMFNVWTAVITISGVFLIAVGIVTFIEMKGWCPDWQRWATLTSCVVPAVYNTRLAIRCRKGKT